MAGAYEVNKDRLWSTLQFLGKIGQDKRGGVTRLSLTEPDMAARAYVEGLMKEAGLTVRRDEAGNLIGRLEGDRPGLPAVMTGSHIDTVVQAGIFDGALGVLGGIEALRTVKERGIRHRHPLEVVCFTDEEGVRFGVGYLGSRAMAGAWTGAWLDAADDRGITLREAFERAGLDPERIANARREKKTVKAYVELHIEQGRVLEERQAPVGMATAIYGHCWLRVTLKGRADHAGTTPMALRRDPAAAAAEALLAAERTALRYGGVATVGTMSLAPGAINVIPGEASFTVDLRHDDSATLQRMKRDLCGEIHAVCKRRRLEPVIDVLDEEAPVSCGPAVLEAIEQSCRASGIPVQALVCGAGHDAAAIRGLCEVGMILVRSRDGISHHPSEWSSPDDCAAGANVLLNALLKLANRT